jgi:hypothetical protein
MTRIYHIHATRAGTCRYLRQKEDTMATRIDNTQATALHVEETRTRTTPRPAGGRSFGAALRTGADVLLGGVEIGATVVGGPLAGAAVRGIRVGASAAAGSPAAAGAGPFGGGGGDEQSTIDEMRAMQQESQAFNLQYLALQEEVQQENRRFTTISNVLKAKHETAKSAIGNIRS